MLDNEWKGWCKRSTMYECSSLVGRPRYLSEKAAPEKQSATEVHCRLHHLSHRYAYKKLVPGYFDIYHGTESLPFHIPWYSEALQGTSKNVQKYCSAIVYGAGTHYRAWSLWWEPWQQHIWTSDRLPSTSSNLNSHRIPVRTKEGWCQSSATED